MERQREMERTITQPNGCIGCTVRRDSVSQSVRRIGYASGTATGMRDQIAIRANESQIPEGLRQTVYSRIPTFRGRSHALTGFAY